MRDEGQFLGVWDEDQLQEHGLKGIPDTEDKKEIEIAKHRLDNLPAVEDVASGRENISYHELWKMAMNHLTAAALFYQAHPAARVNDNVGVLTEIARAQYEECEIDEGTE